MHESIHQLAAIMFTDIVGYTALMGQDEDRALALLKKNKELHERLIAQYNGKLLKEIGDGILASFSSVSDAVYCAGALHKAATIEDISSKIGIHEGEVVFQDDDVFGDGVNIASRILALASGDIVVSEAVHKNIKNKEGVHTEFVKEETLKNIDEPIKIYKVNIEIPEQDRISKSVVESSQLKSAMTNNVNSKRLLIASISISIILVLAYIFYYNQNNKGVTIEPKHKSIAVLAFDDQSPDGNQEWLGDGMADEILNVLAQIKGLKVIGKTSSFSFKGKGATTKEIGEALDVKTVLEGSVIKVGDKYRITAQLIDVDTEAHIWSDKYNRDATDIFTIIDEVSQSIVGSLMNELSIEEVESIKMSNQPIPEAFEYFIKAEHIHEEFAGSGYTNYDILLEAKEMYLKAILLDPDYTDALAGFANLYDSYRLLPGFDNWDVSRRKRDSILNKAYQIDPNAPFALYLKGRWSRNIDSSFYFLKKAYEFDPYHEGMVMVIYKYNDIGLQDVVISLCKKHLTRDPLNKRFQNLLMIELLNTGKIDEAREQARKSLELDEDDYVANGVLFQIKLLVEKDTLEAKRISKRLYQLGFDSLAYSLRKALLLAIQGRKEEALKESSDYRVKILLGMNSEVLSYLDQDINNQTHPYIYVYGYLRLKGNPIYDNIRNEPQFRQLIEEAKFVYEEKKRKYGHLFDN